MKTPEVTISEFDMYRPIKKSIRHARDVRDLITLLDMSNSSGRGPIADLESDRADLEGSGYLVARDPKNSNAIVAMASIHKSVDKAELLALSVLPEYRRRGIGTYFFNQICKELRDGGYQKIEGDSIYPGINFLAANGCTFSRSCVMDADYYVGFSKQLVASEVNPAAEPMQS